MIKCHCKDIHIFPKNGKAFLVDESIPLLFNMTYCKEHDAAKKSLNKLTQLLEKLTKLGKES